METTKPTTHDDPVYEVDGIVHYCVANMPGAVALTSTIALSSSTLHYGLKIADKGAEAACRNHRDLKRGLNVYRGECTCADVGSSFPWAAPIRMRFCRSVAHTANVNAGV